MLMFWEMMEKSKEWLVQHTEKVIAVPFLTELLIALADGHLSEQEFHSLAKGVTGFNLVLLAIAFVAVKFKNSRKR